MKFITPVSMPCTREQYEADLMKPLEEMGYKIWDFSLWDCKLNQYIANCCEELGKIGNVGRATARELNQYHFIPTYNPEFFLALAAMTDEPCGIKGEWWCYQANTYAWFKNGNIYKGIRPINEKSALLDEKGEENGLWKHCGNTCFRKATKEETIKHFTDMEKEKKKTEDLRELIQSGDIVELRDGYIGIVVDTSRGRLFRFENTWVSLSQYDYNLCSENVPDCDIIKIRRPDECKQILPDFFHEAPIIWERKEVKEYTIND